MKTAIVIGATSGIGRGLAKKLCQDGYRVVVTGRRENLLHELTEELNENKQIENNGQCIAYPMDITDTDQACSCFKKILEDMGNVDLVILSAGTGHINFELDWTLDEEVIKVNVFGFTAIASMAFNFFRESGTGHLVGITSIAGLRGTPHTAVYSASKSFDSVYMEGLRALAAKEKKSITITDIRPGFVDTAMAKGKIVMMSSVEKATSQMMNAIKRKKKVAYISKRWNLIAFLWHILPDWVYFKIV